MPLHSIFPDFILSHPGKEASGKYHTPGHDHSKSRTRKQSTGHGPKVSQKLPPYSGPYDVGSLDIEVPARKPRNIAHFTRKKVPLLQLQTVLMTIYYPAQLSDEERSQRKQSMWLGDSRSLMAKGYARFASVPDLVLIPFLRSTTWRTTLSAYEHPRLAVSWPYPEDASKGGYKPVFPLILFSHGLGGTRRVYTTLCGEFASYGFVVCALEHRDGSAPRTLVMHKPSVPDRKEKLQEIHVARSKADSYDVIDFVFPQSDPFDTSPGHDVDAELRRGQIELRTAEVEEAYHVLTMLTKGQGNEIGKANLRLLQTDPDFDWTCFTNRIHLSHVTMVGHSFGAATTAHILRNPASFPYISQGIIYDIWGAPVPIAPSTSENTASPPQADADDDNNNEDDHKHSQNQIPHPLLGINSEAFSAWPPNMHVAQSLIRESLTHPSHPDNLSWLLTVRGSVHINHSDFCILFPHIARAVLKATVDPVRAIDLNIDASLDFLSRTLAPHFKDAQPEVLLPFMAILAHHPTEGLLDQKYLSEIPVTSNPQKHVAIRPKVSDSFRRRLRRKLTPGAKKKVFLDKLGDDEDEVKALRGEVWVHAGPGRPPPDLVPGC